MNLLYVYTHPLPPSYSFPQPPFLGRPRAQGRAPRATQQLLLALCFTHGSVYMFICSSVAKSSPAFCNPMDCSTSGSPVLHLSPRVCTNSCPLSQWCYLTISSSATLVSFCHQSFPASESFPVSQLLASGGHSIGASASASVLAMTIQDWFPLGLIGLLSMQFKGLSRVFSNTTVQKHQFFGT